MSLNPKLFVISALKRDYIRLGSDFETVYLRLDRDGYPSWTSSLGSAKFFKERPNYEEYFDRFKVYIYDNVSMIHVYKVILEQV